MSTTSTLNMYISILAMCWFQQTMSTKHSTFISTSSITKNLYLKKVFAKNAIFSKIMSQSKELFWLIQAPNTAMQIYRNKRAIKKASRKTVYDKVFKVLAKRSLLS